MKILLIEDDIFFQKFYQSKLAEKGHQVDVASNGQEGLQKLSTFLPNVIVLDLIMPIKNGFEFLQDKAQNPQFAGIPVLVFSTLGQENDVNEAKRLGAKDFVNKSFFDFESLNQKIIAVAGQSTTSTKGTTGITS